MDKKTIKKSLYARGTRIDLWHYVQQYREIYSVALSEWLNSRSMLRAIYVSDSRLEIVVEKQYGIHVDRSIVERALLLIDKNEVLPINEIDDYRVLMLSSGSVFLIGVTTGDSSCLFVVDLLRHILRLFELRFGSPIDESVIVEEVSTAYRVLDYTIDSGFPLIDEPNTLNAVLPIDGSGEPSMNILYPWRSNNIAYDSPELLITVTEFVDASIGKSGNVAFSQIRGLVQVLDRLSGIPEVSLTWNTKPQFDDFSCHRCLQCAELDQVMRFIPPDGFFDLMNYRLYGVPASLPIIPEGSVSSTERKLELNIGLKASVALHKCVVYFTLPTGFTSHAINARPGTLKIRNDMAQWTVGRLKLGETARISGSVIGEFESGIVVEPTFTLEFEASGALVSEYSFASSHVSSYDVVPFSGVKYQVMNGKYQVQTGGFF